MFFDIPNPGPHIITGTIWSVKTMFFTCIDHICNSNAYRVGYSSESNENFDLFSWKITYRFDDQEVSYSRRNSGEWRPFTKSSTVLQSFRYSSNCKYNNYKRIFSQKIIIPRRRGTDTWFSQQLNTIFDTDKFSQMIKITGMCNENS